MTVVDNAAPAAWPAATATSAGTGAPAGPGGDPGLYLEALFDPGTLRLLTPHDASGALAVSGEIGGALAVAFASDPGMTGGAVGADSCAPILAAYDEAIAQGAPVIGLWHSSGAQTREGMQSLHASGQVFAVMTRASGVVPQISVVLGSVAGCAAHGPALADVVILSGQGRIFVSGPDAVRSVTGEDVAPAELGGPEPHSRRSGVAHVAAATEAEAIARARELALLLSDPGAIDLAKVQLDTIGQETVLLESGGRGGPSGLADHLPASPRDDYDVRPLLADLLDATGVELHPHWAPNVVTILGRLAGRPVGVIANNPLWLGGCLDAASADKAARFVRMCDAFGVPLVVVVDVPGYLPGAGQEWDGVARRGAKLLHAFAEAAVPRVTVVTRKAYGGAFIAMNSRSLGATKVLAWPTAELAVTDPATAQAGGLARALAVGVVDEVIHPVRTREAIARAIAGAPQSRGTHGNIPL